MVCEANAASGTPVPKNSILVVGATGTLGRQIVRKALDEGYDVRCIVRPRMNPADFLRDWGATTVQVRRRCFALCGPWLLSRACMRMYSQSARLDRGLVEHATKHAMCCVRAVYIDARPGATTRSVAAAALTGAAAHAPRSLLHPPRRPLIPIPNQTPQPPQADLTDLTSLPATLVGVSAIIDCATARPEESTQDVDWAGKVALIQCAQAMGINRYIFFSIFNCDKHPEVPLMNIKACTEDFLANSGVNFTVLRLCGFMQAVIGNYAVPILEDRPVWGTNDETRTAYLDTQVGGGWARAAG
jgi:uncharacterized protein YbjT (DUF2867 family)